MTITRRWQAGAECDTTNSHNVEFGIVNSGFAASATQKRTGAYSYRINKLDGENYGQVNIDATYQIRIGMHLYTIDSATPGDVPAYVAWYYSGGRLGSLRVDEAGDLRLYVLGVSQDEEIGARPDAVWAHFGINIKIDGSSGWVTVYKDGVQIMNFAGDTGSNQIESVRFGTDIHALTTHEDYSYLDDLFIDDITNESDGVVPDYRFEYITPEAPSGNYSQCMGSDGNQVNNFELVDDQPHDGDATYVEANAINKKDTYNMTTFTLDDGWGITAVIPVAIAKKSDAGVATQVAMMTRYDVDDTIGDAQDLPESYGYMWERIVNCPGETGWTQAQLDAVEVGFEGRGTF